VADQLATPTDLAARLQVPASSLDAASAAVALEGATAIVQQAAGGQRIVQVVDDVIELLGTTDSWLDLPQIPVTSVSAVTLDGTVQTLGADTNGYKRFGSRLWRRHGWQTNYGWPDAFSTGLDEMYYSRPSFLPGVGSEPSSVVVTCTHGYPSTHQSVQLGRSAVLALAATPFRNPTGATALRIGDYYAAYEAMAAQMEASPNLRKSLHKAYGRRGGLVRIG
jgi:hypothetical protein